MNSKDTTIEETKKHIECNWRSQKKKNHALYVFCMDHFSQNPYQMYMISNLKYVDHKLN